MTDSQQLGIRFSAELIARIDAHVERLRTEAAWSNPNRAMAIRLLVTAALEAAEREAERASTGRSKRRG